MRRRAVWAVALLATVVLLGGCGQGPTPPSQAPKPGPSSPESRDPEPGPTVTARVRIVDLFGQPLQGMAPIATHQPNAFDEPCATGALTGSDGYSSIDLNTGEWLYVRAWDPATHYFANNFFDVPPGDAPVGKTLELTMAPGATLKARLMGAGGGPVVDETVGLMMMHPNKGPWWPGEARTDAEGRIVFSPVPPGRFLLRFKAAESGMAELPEVSIDPGGVCDLATVPLN